MIVKGCWDVRRGGRDLYGRATDLSYGRATDLSYGRATDLSYGRATDLSSDAIMMHLRFEGWVGRRAFPSELNGRGYRMPGAAWRSRPGGG